MRMQRKLKICGSRCLVADVRMDHLGTVVSTVHSPSEPQDVYYSMLIVAIEHGGACLFLLSWISIGQRLISWGYTAPRDT